MALFYEKQSFLHVKMYSNVKILQIQLLVQFSLCNFLVVLTIYNMVTDD